MLAKFEYTVDARGNRTQVTEMLRGPGSNVTTREFVYNTSEISYAGSWTNNAPYKVLNNWEGSLTLEVTASQISFTYGTGPDHSLFDVYVGGSLWQTYDGYSPTVGEKTDTIYLDGLETLPFEIRNRPNRHLNSTGEVMRFRRVVATVDLAMGEIDYTYDALGRLAAADYDQGAFVFTYAYDVSGNLTNNNGVIRVYNAANQMVQNGAVALTYDPSGNLITDGSLTYAWDSANRLRQVTGGGLTHQYSYNGDGQRMAQSVNGLLTRYLLDTQPGLSQVIGETTSSTTTYHTHSPRGIHASYTGSQRTDSLTDGLGSVRARIDATGNVLKAVSYSPYGLPNTDITGFAFTGEPRDLTGLQHHRARYYAPGLASWASLDPWEGTVQRAMSLNGYSWVEGNVGNATDSKGNCIDQNVGLELLPLFQIANVPSGNTQCQKFIEELRVFTDRFVGETNNLSNPIALLNRILVGSPKNLYFGFLAKYYADIPFMIGPIPFINRFGGQAAGFERYGLPNREQFPGADAWRNPMYYRDQAAQELRRSYGFKRPYYGNTHHYFAFLKLAYATSLAGTINYERELNDLRNAYNDWKNEKENIEDAAARYAWFYLDVVNDIYITDHAINIGEKSRILEFPDVIADEMCADSEVDVWSLDPVIAQYYFRLPSELLPDAKYWPS